VFAFGGVELPFPSDPVREFEEKSSSGALVPLETVSESAVLAADVVVEGD
jgi:hypothetical protein